MIPGGWELIVIIGVLILLFGAKRLPEMARSIGQSARVFKGEMKGMKSDDEAAAPPAAQPPAPPALRPGQPTEADNGQGAPNRSEHTS
jgi:sec-independent protein translocase protein TatA